jgi:effector-binding domain-containing protein
VCEVRESGAGEVRDALPHLLYRYSAGHAEVRREEGLPALYSPKGDAFSETVVPPLQYTADDVDSALATLAEKKPNPALSLTRLMALDEGRSIQILHVGSYDDEAPTLARLHDEYLPQNGLTINGLHHEVYLSDARRTAPEKLRTVLRQPVRALGLRRISRSAGRDGVPTLRGRRTSGPPCRRSIP